MEQSTIIDASGGAIAEWLAEQEAAARGRANDQRPNSSSEHWHRAQAAAYEAAHAYAIVRPVPPAASTAKREGFTCAARSQGSAGGNDPADCSWPVCGCDPHADKVIAALQESGLLASAPPAPVGEAPVGWKLVPVEPTEAMIDAATESFSGEGAGPDHDYDDDVRRAYKALLAPPPPAPTPEAGSDLATDINSLKMELDVVRQERDAALKSQRYWSGEAARAADALAEAKATSPRSESAIYQYREIGEGEGWQACSKAAYDHFQRDPTIDTRELSSSPPPAEDLAGQGEPVATYDRYEQARAIAEAAANHWDKFSDTAGVQWLAEQIYRAGRRIGPV